MYTDIALITVLIAVWLFSLFSRRRSQRTHKNQPARIITSWNGIEARKDLRSYE